MVSPLISRASGLQRSLACMGMGAGRRGSSRPVRRHNVLRRFIIPLEQIGEVVITGEALPQRGFPAQPLYAVWEKGVESGDYPHLDVLAGVQLLRIIWVITSVESPTGLDEWLPHC